MVGALIMSSDRTQISEDTYNSCDLSTDPLFEWGLPSVDNSVSIQGLVPGEYFFLCAVAGHCDAGMKIKVQSSLVSFSKST